MPVKLSRKLGIRTESKADNVIGNPIGVFDVAEMNSEVPSCGRRSHRAFRHGSSHLLLVLASLALGFSLSEQLYAEDLDDLGPIYDRFPLTLETGERTEMLGPVFNCEKKESESSLSLVPLFSYRGDPLTDFTQFDLLYPIISYQRFGSDYRFHLFQVISFAGSQGLADERRSRVSLYPFYFHQRSRDSNQNYTALFPLYGRLKNRFLRDDIRFILFPGYSRTAKKDVVTQNYLYPFFHWRHGEKLHGWQCWPLMGMEHKEATAKTNQLDEIEVIGGHKKSFGAWPFFFRNQLGIGTENPQRQLVVLPFYSKQTSPQRDSTSYLWPFGYTVTDDREKKYREWGAPWPLIVFARGEGKTANRVWPLFSRAKTPTLQSSFYLWPLYKENRVTAEPLDRRRTRILLFLYSELIEKNTATGTALERTDLWPLFTARRDHNGNERLQIFAPLEPIIPNNERMERNYSPLWSVWRSEKNGKTGARSESLLWNLYRRDSTPSSKKLSLLCGLFRYQSDTEGKRVRLFYIPVGKAKTKGSTAKAASR